MAGPDAGGYIGHGKKIFIQYVSCPRNPLDKEGETWLVSEKTTSWMCGVHAFYTDFKRCLSHLDRYNSKTERKFPVVSENKRFHYVVILRHPIHRFLSEYLHTLRGACWLHNHYCNGEKTYWPLASNLSKPCFELLHCSQAHINITLEEFADCKDAWSTNRQTVVLADIDEASCWSKSSYTQKERNKLLLDSAKHNLRKLSYFGLTEFQEESGDLFERTFGLNFLNPPKKIEFNDTHAGKVVHSVVQDSELYKRVVQRNCLDLELYKFALGLFEQRLNAIGKPLNRTTLDYIRTTLPDDSFLYRVLKIQQYVMNQNCRGTSLYAHCLFFYVSMNKKVCMEYNNYEIKVFTCTGKCIVQSYYEVWSQGYLI